MSLIKIALFTVSQLSSKFWEKEDILKDKTAVVCSLYKIENFKITEKVSLDSDTLTSPKS